MLDLGQATWFYWCLLGGCGVKFSLYDVLDKD